MIAQYEASDRDAELDAPREYGLSQQHKHLKEMRLITGLSRAPLVSPLLFPIIIVEWLSMFLCTLIC